MRPSRDAPAFRAGAGPFRRTLSNTLTFRVPRDTTHADMASMQLTHDSRTKTQLSLPDWQGRLTSRTMLRARPSVVVAPFAGSNGRLRTRKQMRMVGVDARIPAKSSHQTQTPIKAG